MKKILLFILLTSATYAFTGQNSGFFYSDLHSMGGLPMVGVGTRAHRGTYGIDLSFNALPLSFNESPDLFHARALTLLYPTGSSLYLGAGLGLLKEPETMKKVGGSFEGSLGYEWDSGVFLQINGTRLFHHTSGAKVWPGLTLGYGF